MFCPHCGANVADSAQSCPQCGAALHAGAAEPRVEVSPNPGEIKDYLTMNIVLLVLSVCCCGAIPSIVTGIIGVIFSSQTRDHLRNGRLNEAAQKSRTARAMAIATGVILAVTALILIVIIALYGALFFAMVSSYTPRLQFPDRSKKKEDSSCFVPTVVPSWKTTRPSARPAALR